MTATARMARLMRAYTDAAESDALSLMDWTTAQHAFLHHPAPRKLLRTGNQIGKTTVGLAECILLALGRHPHQRHRRAPLEVWVLCASWSQSLAIQGKLWALLPRAEVDADTRYNSRTGFGQHAPLVRFCNGSIIRIKTTQQGALNLAGATIDHAMFDEPPHSPRVFAEVLKRVQARAGTVSITMTPINAPVDYIRKQCEDRQIEDLHFPLTEQTMTHTRSRRLRRLPDGTPCDAAWIRKIEAESLPHEVPVVVHGEWDAKVLDRVFSAFRAMKGKGGHITAEDPTADVRAVVGLDHGTTAGAQGMVLVGVEDMDDGYPMIWVLDEVWHGHPTTTEQDAADLLAMLQRNGLEWGDLHRVYGDIPSSSRGDPGRKGNRDVEDMVARRLGKRNRASLHPRVRTVKQGRWAGRGSVILGVRWLHQQMIRDRFRVHARCERVIESLGRWDGRSDSEWKHILDAMRYAVWDEIRANPGGPGYAGSALRTR